MTPDNQAAPRNRWYPLSQLFLVRLREFYREPEAIFWVYGFPLILTIGLGIAFWSKKPEPSSVDIQEPLDSVVAGKQVEELKKELTAAGMDVQIHNAEECSHRFRTGKTALIVVFRSEANFDLVCDETRPESLSARYQAEAAIREIIGSRPGRTYQLMELAMAPAAATPGVPLGSLPQISTAGQAVNSTSFPLGACLTIRSRAQQEPGQRYIDFLLPGIMGLNLLGGGLYGVGFVIVEMRVRKLLKRLLATPMRRSDFLLSVLGSRLVLLLPEIGVLLLLGRLLFGVPMRGNLLALAIVVLAGAAAFAGIGLVLACRTEKTETISGLINLVMLPMWLLSGTFFSAKRFPDPAQPFIQALPLTQINDGLREVMLEGATLSQVGWRVGILAAWAIVSFTVALRLFKWQ